MNKIEWHLNLHNIRIQNRRNWILIIFVLCGLWWCHVQKITSYNNQTRIKVSSWTSLLTQGNGNGQLKDEWNISMVQFKSLQEYIGQEILLSQLGEILFISTNRKDTDPFGRPYKVNITSIEQTNTNQFVCKYKLLFISETLFWKKNRNSQDGYLILCK